VGVIVGSDIIALRKVNIQATDYAYQEYGLSPLQVQEAEERIDAGVNAGRRAKTVKEFKGDWRELRE
jgi:hypothetical protein